MVVVLSYCRSHCKRVIAVSGLALMNGSHIDKLIFLGINPRLCGPFYLVIVPSNFDPKKKKTGLF